MKNYNSTILALVLLVFFLSGCGTLSTGRHWGQDVTVAPGFDRLGAVALKTLRDPAVWGPAVGAAVFSLGNLDEEVSEWATDETPIFDSQETADDVSSDLRNAATMAFVLTGLATPSGDDWTDWVRFKAQGILVGGAALLATSESTSALKSWIDKSRPDREDEKSFPSGHTSTAFVSASLAARNINTLPLTGGQKTLAKVGVYSLAAGTAWARVEARRHYPSDVLAGAALGNFFALFFNDAFLGLEDKKRMSLHFSAAEQSVLVGFQLGF